MLNQLTNVFHQQAKRRDRGDRLWQMDDQPGRRLVWLMLLFCLPFGAIIVRVGWIQIVKADRFLEATSRPHTRESFEPIPSHDGRILGADGKVLAYDEEQYLIRIHYRWLEEPPHPRWLRERALERLPRTERGDKEKVREKEQLVLSERERMWDSLAEVTQRPREELTKLRNQIQKRIAHIRENVESRREEKRLANIRDENERETAKAWPNRTDAGEITFNLESARIYWNLLVHEMTTLSHEHEEEPLILQEELDYHTLLSGIDLSVAAHIEALPDVFPGVTIGMTTHRIYPHGSYAPHIVGLRAQISENELKARKTEFPQGDPLDYRPGDRIGKTGVEKSYDRQLRGLRGLKRIVTNRQGEIIRTEVVREPRMGQDVTLTLHPSLQRQAEQILADVLTPKPTEAESTATEDSPDEKPAMTPTGASLVVLDVHTGAVLAGVSAPGYDINVLQGNHSEQWNAIMTDSRRPLFPRMTHMAIPPGSVFKTVSSIALLESGKIDPDEPHYCQGYLFDPSRYRCYVYRHYGHGHGDLTFQDAFAMSCNVYFYNAGRVIGLPHLSGWADRLGFGRPTGIDLPGEKRGTLPRPSTTNSQAAQRQSLSTALGLAIGQSRLTATPLQVARMMAAVGNGGELVTPHVVSSFGPMGGEFDFSLRKYPEHAVQNIAVSSPATWQRVQEALARVVSHPRGTGYKRVRLPEVSIAGKTGTAEVGGGKPDHAWFAGFVPAEQPRYAFVVVLENGGSGGSDAGPVARQLVEAMVKLDLLPSTNVARQD
ncbi:MAG: penicillin-binding transpeptidase domain-containing protein [Planctomycetota bacterium]|nr:penicillin-binding transpeptidase domain-containing protein [Planctomycetota bacterium]MDA1212734.1 penicillin-binding transpeptidase domain-containing protein [Planctomycetota bacterium]